MQLTLRQKPCGDSSTAFSAKHIRTVHSQLCLRRLRFAVRLGWTEAERIRPQPVEIDIALRFPKPPLACLSDELEQTICYDALTAKVRDLLERETFKLIEFMAQSLHELLRKHVEKDTEIWVRVLKIATPVTELHGGVSFALGDWQPQDFS